MQRSLITHATCSLECLVKYGLLFMEYTHTYVHTYLQDNSALLQPQFYFCGFGHFFCWL